MSTPSPSPSNVGHEAEEEWGKATKTVKAEAGEDDGAGAFIKIKVESLTADDVWFRIKRHVKLGRLMDIYCSKHSIHPTHVRFLSPDGRPIWREQTPDEVGLEDGDAIDLILTQEGLSFINIKVQSRTGDDVVLFRIKRDVKLQRLMDMYCGKHSLHPKAVLFVDPKGRIIRPNQTPDEIGLRNGDTIDVIMLTQEGGSINIKVQSETADDVWFRFKRDAKLQRLMDAYCGKHSLHPKAVLFLDPKGLIIWPDQTPDEVRLQDGDAIYISLTKVHGAACETEICMTAV